MTTNNAPPPPAITTYIAGMFRGVHATVDALTAALSAYQASGATHIPVHVVRDVLDGITAATADEEATLQGHP